MIASNVEAARFLDKNHIPAPYRVHEPPPDGKLETLVMFLRGDFADMMMLMIPVLVNSVMMLIACWYEGSRKELAV